MVSQQFRALAAALVLTTAGVAVGTIATTTVAEAAARPQVGKLLQQAIDLAKGGSTSAANAKVSQAEAVGGLTPGDQAAIAQVKSFIAAKSGTGATGSKAKFAADYNAGRYQQVVGPLGPVFEYQRGDIAMQGHEIKIFDDADDPALQVHGAVGDLCPHRML